MRVRRALHPRGHREFSVKHFERVMRCMANASILIRNAGVLIILAFASAGVPAHDFKAGALVIDHPYAIPTPPGARTRAVYFRTLKNTGLEPDRLVGARTTAAVSVEIHRSTMDGDVMRMRQIDGLDLPAGAEIKVRHGGEVHLMLIGLKEPLKLGDRFPIWLRFQRAGEREVMAWVQQPRDTTAVHKH
jgi:copper(I)-binding protein